MTRSRDPIETKFAELVALGREIASAITRQRELARRRRALMLDLNRNHRVTYAQLRDRMGVSHTLIDRELARAKLEAAEDARVAS